VGNLCTQLCKTENKYEYIKNYKLVDCYNFKASYENIHSRNTYKSVFIYEEQGNGPTAKRMVLKSRKQYYYDFDVQTEAKFNEKPIIDQLTYLADYFESTLNRKFGIQIDQRVKKWLQDFRTNPKTVLDIMHKNYHMKDLIYYVKLFAAGNFDIFLDALRNNDSESLGNYIANLVVLMSQDEYLFFKFFQAKPGNLKIEGTCAHFYFVEYAEPLTYQIRKMSDSNRTSLALKFLDLIHQLDTIYLVNEKQFVESDTAAVNVSAKSTTIPVQMCDMKLDNFGVNEQGELKLIDTDMVNTEASIFYEKVCTVHEDCDYFDCKAYCDPVAKKCSKFRINNNLQSLCEKIFNNPWLKEDGVLTGMSQIGSNVKHELTRRLNDCQNPGFYLKSNISKAADTNLFNVFRVFLNDKGLVPPSS
jgi:hypothetical protein